MGHGLAISAEIGQWTGGRRAAAAFVLVLSAALLAVAGVVGSLSQWYDWSPPWLSRFDELAQRWPWLAELGFGRYLLVVLAAAAAGTALFALIGYRPSSPVIHDPAACGEMAGRKPISDWPLALLGVAVGLEVAVAWTVVRGELPSAVLWSLAPVAAALALKLWERGSGRAPLLGGADWLYVLAYHCALAACAFVGSRSWGGAVVSSGLAGGAFYGAVAVAKRGGVRSELWDHRSQGVLLLLGLGYFALAAWELNSWRFAVVGDEYSFFLYAWQLLKGVLEKPLLTGVGNYGMHPILSSYIQAASMWVWGANNYGWRISNVLMVSSSLLFWYVFVRAIASERVALLATGFLACSHYLVGFSKIGYNNLQALWPACVALALLVLALRRDSVLGFWLAGAVAGLGFYVFALARFVAPALILLLLLYRSPFRRRYWPCWAALILGILVVALPIAAERGTSEVLWRQTVFSDVDLAPQALLAQVRDNAFRAAVSSLTSRKHTHFIYGAHLDPLTGALALLGMAGLCMGWRKERMPWAMLCAYLAAVLILGGLTQYDYPPNTRLFGLIPFAALMAAIGGDSVGRVLARITGWPRLRGVLGAAFVAMAFCLSAYIVFDRLPARRAVTQESLLVKMMLEMESGAAPLRPLFVIRAPGDQYELLRYLRLAYGIERVETGVLTPQQAVEVLRAGEPAATPAVVLLPSQLGEQRQLVVDAAKDGFPGATVTAVVDWSGAYHFEQILAPVAVPASVGIRLTTWSP